MRNSIAYIPLHFLVTLQDSKSDKDWEEFFRIYDELILTIIRKIVKNREDVKDYSQEVKLHIWRRIASYTPGGARFTSWLNLVIRNKVLDILRRQEKQKLEYSEDYIYDEEALDHSSEAEFRGWQSYILNKTLENVSQSVSPRQLEFIKLYFSGLAIPDICLRMNISKDHAYQLKKRVKDRLQREVVKYTHL